MTDARSPEHGPACALIMLQAERVHQYCPRVAVLLSEECTVAQPPVYLITVKYKCTRYCSGMRVAFILDGSARRHLLDDRI